MVLANLRNCSTSIWEGFARINKDINVVIPIVIPYYSK